MYRLIRLFVVVLPTLSFCQQKVAERIDHRAICNGKLQSSVVRIDNADGRGTGFVVSSDGFILTAAHVVIDPNTGQYYRTISVTSPHQWTEFATPVMNITEAATHDFALLKVNRSNLPSLELGAETTVDIGSPLTIIGFPFSALDDQGDFINVKFCLAGLVAGKTTFGIGKSEVNAVYFQGVSVKGISGSPVISDDTGKVIGVVSTKLTGIGKDLQQLAQDIQHGKGQGVSISGFTPGQETLKVIRVLDLQLANGLGMATGARDAAYALKKAQREYKKQHPN